VEAVRSEPVSTANSLLTGKNTGKIHQNGLPDRFCSQKHSISGHFYTFPRFQITGNIIFNNRERAENNREKWVLSSSVGSTTSISDSHLMIPNRRRERVGQIAVRPILSGLHRNYCRI
jgi:hypothetical protein